MEKIVRSILELIRIFVTALWAILGLFFWIPLLIRMTFAFTSTVVVSAFSEVDIRSAEAGLHHATRFYISGFQIINQAINNVVSDKPIEGSTTPLTRVMKRSVWLNLGFSLLFWVITVGTIALSVGRTTSETGELTATAVTENYTFKKSTIVKKNPN